MIQTLFYTLVVVLVGALSKEIPLACELALKHQQCQADVSSGQCVPDASDNRRLVAIGDVHGSYAGVLELLYEAKIISSPSSCIWKEQGNKLEDGVVLVQVGDIVDRGPSSWEAYECFRNLQKEAPKYHSKIVRLVGNHDVWWLNAYFRDRNATADTRDVLQNVINAMITDIYEGTLLLSYTHRRHNIPLLFIHAGIRPQFYAYLQKSLYPSKPSTVLTPEEISIYTNSLLVKDFGTCTSLPCQKDKAQNHELFEAGPDRGGAGIGGPLWTDYSVLEKAAKNKQEPKHFIQVVGHTMAFCYSPRHMNIHPPMNVAECALGLVRASEGLQSICVDGGMYIGARAYMELTKEAHFVAFERYRGDKNNVEYNIYQKRDLTYAACKHL